MNVKDVLKGKLSKLNLSDNKMNKKEGGFTIVEVMIVLAIAGLVMAIVFIAVPALQRNSRDAQRRADVAAVQSAIATFVGNNNGSVPSTNPDLLEAVESIDFSFYNDDATLSPPTHVTAWLAAAGENKIFTANITTVMNVQSGDVEQHDFAIYIEGAVCNSAVATIPKAVFPATTTTAGNTLIDVGPSRSYAILYGVESDPNWVCIDNV